MSTVQTPAQSRARAVRMVDVDHLLARLKALQKHQVAGGFTSHGHGVRKAIELIQRDLASKPEPGSVMPDRP